MRDPNALFLAFVEYLTARLELCVIDFVHGGFLPPEKRAIYPYVQPRLGNLAARMARFRILDNQERLRNKLLILSKVLRNEYPELTSAYFSKDYRPKRG